MINSSRSQWLTTRRLRANPRLYQIYSQATCRTRSIVRSRNSATRSVGHATDGPHDMTVNYSEKDGPRRGDYYCARIQTDQRRDGVTKSDLGGWATQSLEQRLDPEHINGRKPGPLSGTRPRTPQQLLSNNRLIHETTRQLLHLVDGTTVVLNHPDKREVLLRVDPKPRSGNADPVVGPSGPRLTRRRTIGHD